MSRQASTAAALFAQALDAHRQGKFALAELLYWKVLDLDPKHPQALGMLGLLEAHKGNTSGAVDLLRKSIAIQPNNPTTHLNLALLLQSSGAHGDAVTEFDHTMALSPGTASLHNSRGVSLHQVGRHQDALESFTRAAQLDPRSAAEAHMNAGVSLYELKRFEESLASLELALQMVPGNADVRLNQGNTLIELNRHEEALQAFRDVIAKCPQAHDVLMNMANALRDLRRFDEALEYYDRALSVAVSNADIHFNRSLCLLTMGDYERGWEEYEWRRKVDLLYDTQREFSAPLWLGAEPLQGKTILLHAEQGLGDTIQFCRYAALVAAQGAFVILEVQKSLIDILHSMDGVDQLIATGADPGPYDYHCPLLSLPFALRTTHCNLPAAVPYLSANPERITRWRDVINPGKPGLRIGLAWAGNTAHRQNHHRSVKLLARLLAVIPAGARCWSLQKEVCDEDLSLIVRSGRMWCFDANAFPDTAAQIMSLDVVITVDTSIAHLAGALGKPTLLLLAFNCDWRWMTQREDSPWYPHMRLLRQSTPGDWASVLTKLSHELRTLRLEPAGG